MTTNHDGGQHLLIECILWNYFYYFRIPHFIGNRKKEEANSILIFEYSIFFLLYDPLHSIAFCESIIIQYTAKYCLNKEIPINVQWLYWTGIIKFFQMNPYSRLNYNNAIKRPIKRSLSSHPLLLI